MSTVNAACLATTFLLLYAFISALRPVTLAVDKRQGFPPMTVQAEVRIPRHVDNREACVVLVGPVEDASCWELSIDSSPVFRRKWSGLSGGRYLAQARLRRGRDTLFSNAVELYVAEEP